MDPRAWAVLLAALWIGAASAHAQSEDLAIEAELEPARVYVGGEARLLLRLYRARGVTHGELRAPALGDAAELSALGPIRVYEAERDGVRYDVLERSYAVVPHHAGLLIVPGALFESATAYAEQFIRGGPRAPEARTLRGPSTTLEVREPPPGTGVPWLPARRLTLEERWSRDPQALSRGDFVTRTLVVRAEGLAAERLPRLEMPEHPALLVHYDRPELHTDYLAEGLSSRSVQRIVLLAVAEAELRLPEIRVRWWDVGADTPRTATLAGRSLRLHPAIAPAAAPRAAAIQISTTALLRLALLGGLAFAGLVFWWHRRGQARRAARRRLRRACRRNDARAARDALLDWGRAVAPAALPVLVPQVGRADLDASAQAQLCALDEALYAGRAWDGAAFWRSVGARLRKTRVRHRPPAAPGLGALFRLQARSRVAL